MKELKEALLAAREGGTNREETDGFLIAIKELVFQHEEKEKRAAELIIANKELAYQNKQKDKRAAELILANKELAFQNEEKEKRAAELIKASKELAYQNREKDKRAAELVLAHNELLLQTTENEKRSIEISYLAAIVESSDDAIVSKSLDGIIRTWNKGSERMFGYTATEAIGKHISFIIPQEYIYEGENMLTRIKNNETVVHYETTRRKKNGELFPVALTISSLKDSAGNAIGFCKIARDITVHKRLEQALISANEELTLQNDEKEVRAQELTLANEEVVEGSTLLELANKELEAFSYSISHDLRAPLRGIHGYTQILKEDFGSELKPGAERVMNNIMKSAERMGRLIDDLLSFSRIGRKELQKTKVNLHQMVIKICEEAKAEQSHRQIEFRIQPIPATLADSAAIHQVWVNLISNAVKYTAVKEKAVIEINSRIKGKEIIYSIKDNGAGFDMQYADNLFGVFQRLHTEKEFEGTGVGLAIVQRIVAKHGGRVWADAKVNEGATFCFTLIKT